MMGFSKPQRFANFEGADFIYYGNIREFVFKNWCKPKWGNPLLFGETDFTVWFADPMFLIDVKLLWSYDYSKWVIFMKNHILQWKILNLGSLYRRVKSFAPNYQKAHPYAKSGRTNRLAYVAVTLFWRFTAARKKVRENRHWKLDVATASSWSIAASTVYSEHLSTCTFLVLTPAPLPHTTVIAALIAVHKLTLVSSLRI